MTVRYGCACVEFVICPDSTKGAILHLGVFTVENDTSLATLKAQLPQRLAEQWQFGGAEACDGEVDVRDVALMPAPLGSDADLEDWHRKQREQFRRKYKEFPTRVVAEDGWGW